MNKRFIKATFDKNELQSPVHAPYFRKTFLLDFDIECAELSICGLGFYRLYVNGADITKGALAPYISNPDHYCYVDTYDVKKLLRKGENVIGVLLGNGMMNPVGGFVWELNKADWAAPPCLALECNIKGQGERSLCFSADETFKTHPSPILFDELRFGEVYDARLELDGWSEPDFDDSDWANALSADTPRGALKKCSAEPIKVIKELKPISVTKYEDGYLYDFGQNSAGVCRLNVNAREGQHICMYHCETLKRGKFYVGNIIFENNDYYKSRGYKIYPAEYTAKEGPVSWSPQFTYYGFRYVLVEGITEEQATSSLLTFCVMSSDLPSLGSFSCSDGRINTLYSMVDNALRSNFYYIQTDCPHREKNGWTGDASLSSDFAILMYDTEKSWREWLYNIRKAMREDGALPGIVPTGGWGFKWGNGPTWDSVLFNLPYQLYKLRGCADVIKENAPAMMRYLNYITGKRDSKGLVAIGLGDWVPVGKSCNKYDAPLELTDSIMVMDMAKKAAEMFSAVSLYNQACFADAICQEMRAAIREHLLDLDTMTAAGACQTSQAVAIYYGAFDDNEKPEAAKRLIEFIHEKDDAFDCGFIGMHTIFHVLSEFGEGELAFRMITRNEFPSYTQLIELGHTAMPEHFRLREDGEFNTSLNHHFLGDINRWFINRIAGIRPISADTVEICPDLISSVSSAEASYRMPHGEVSINWERLRNDVSVCVRYRGDVKLSLSQKLSAATVNIIHLKD